MLKAILFFTNFNRLATKIMKKILLICFLFSISVYSQENKNYFVHLSSDPMLNPSAAIMSIHSTSEALSQGHDVT